MNLKRYLGVLGVFIFVSGCVGTLDSLHVVKGEAPLSDNCEVIVTDPLTAGVIANEKVAGIFSVVYVSGGVLPEVDVTAYCNGAKVRALKAVAPRNVGDIDLGKLAP